MVYLVSLYLLLYFFLSWRRLSWAVLIIIAALPSYLIRFKIFGMPFTLLEAMILISFFAWFLKNYKQIIKNLKDRIKKNSIPQYAGRNSKFFKYPFRYEIILLLIISYIAAGIAGFSDSALGIWKAYFFEPILLFIIIINVFKASDIGKIIWAFLVSALVVSLTAIYQKITGSFIFSELWAAEETRRVTSFFGYPNAAGLYLGPIALTLVGFLFSQIRNKKNQISNFQFPISKQFSIANHQLPKIILVSLTISLSILSIYFAKSVGALIGVATGLIVFGLLANRKARSATVAIILLAVIIIGVYQPFRQTAYKYLTLNNFSGQIRKLQWQETWAMLKDGRIITGAGLANYQEAIAPYHQEGFFYNKDNDTNFHRQTVFNAEYRAKVWQPLEIYLYPHNIFLNFWSELGLAGMLLFIWIMGKYFVIGVALNRKSKISKNNFFIIGLLGAMIVIIVHGLVDVPYFKNDLAVVFWVIVAMLGMVDLEVRKDKI